MIHRLFTTCSCVGTSDTIVCVSKPLKVSSAQWRSSYLSNFRRQWRQGTATWGCDTGALIPTLPPSSSSAFGVNSLPCASWQSFDCFGPSPLTCGANKRRVRSIHRVLSTFLAQIVNPEGQTAVDGCKGIHHTRSPNCAKGHSAPSTFRLYAVLPSRPTANRRCMLAA